MIEKNRKNTPLEKLKHLLLYLLDTKKLPFYFLLATVITLIVECFSRRSIAAGLTFLFTNPFAFCANYGIILLSLLCTLFGRRRIAWLSLVSLFWIALGVAEFVILSFRVTPLTAVDFSILPNVISIITIYLSPFQIGLIVTLLIIAIVCLVVLFVRVPKYRIAFRKGLVSIACVLCCFLATTAVGMKTESISTTFPNLANAYRDYGFAYCFSLSVFDKGIDEPDDYSQEAVDKLLAEIPEEDGETGETPNVIVVQLESLFNVNRLSGLTFSENPLPTYTYLLENYQSGLLTVPVIGAGTVNTEFEVLTGMSVQHFGAGEYPYKSILKDHTCETLAYTLAESGLTAHAIHNHQGTFYKRNAVYKNLGFSSFTPIEYMLDPTYNDTFWAKDALLTDEIAAILSSTEGRDFVFAVSVQGHGKYPTDYAAKENEITVTSGFENDPERLSQYTYYVNQLHETDLFIKALYEAVMASEEPTVLMLYGDHLPALSIENEMLSDGTVFETEYVLLSNYETLDNTRDADLFTYQLYPTLMKTLDNDNGLINRFHQTKSGDEDFLDKLTMLEYDILYGENYAKIDNTRYPKMNDMTLGTKEISIDDVTIKDDVLYITGKNFTPYSVVALDGNAKETVYIDQNTLSVELSLFDNAFELVTVRQTTDKGTVLSETAPFLRIQKKELSPSSLFTCVIP